MIIENNENGDNFLNKYNYNAELEREKLRNRSNEIFVQKSQKYISKINFEKDKYFKLYVK
jgi:hypothetical protein